MENAPETRWLCLSYPLDGDTPAYGGGEGLRCEAARCMDRGDSCNASVWTFSNHLGTHLDFPRHFSPDGRTLDDYPMEFFMFERVGFIALERVEEGEILTWERLQGARIFRMPRDADLLLIKTGFGAKRGTPAYRQANPGFSPGLARDLRGRFPALRVLGFDSISLSSFAHRDLGREAHRAFLDHERPVLPLEDMDLSPLSAAWDVVRVLVVPLRVRGADGAPCTVPAQVELARQNRHEGDIR